LGGGWEIRLNDEATRGITLTEAPVQTRSKTLNEEVPAPKSEPAGASANPASKDGIAPKNDKTSNVTKTPSLEDESLMDVVKSLETATPSASPTQPSQSFDAGMAPPPMVNNPAAEQMPISTTLLPEILESPAPKAQPTEGR
jgi:hypothetical protein